MIITIIFCGCSSYGSHITATDNNAPQGEVSFAYNLDKFKQAAIPHTGTSITFGIGNTKGSGNQTLATGQLPILLNNTTFTAPQQLKNDFDFIYSSLAMRNRYFGEGNLGIEFTVGLNYFSTDLKVSSSAQTASERVIYLGYLLGLGVIYRVNHGSSFQTRVSVVGPLENTIEQFEIIYEKAFQDNFHLNAGFASWHIHGDSNSGSDYKLSFSGPILKLGIDF